MSGILTKIWDLPMMLATLAAIGALPIVLVVLYGTGVYMRAV